MKERIIKKLDERIEYILNKEVKDITLEEFTILSTKLGKIEYEETKDERNKEYAEIMTKLLIK